MELRLFWLSMPMQERDAFAKRCGSSFAHVRNVAYGQKSCAEKLAINIDRESGGKVRCESLRPDVDWAYMRNSGAAPSQTQDEVRHGL